MCSSIEDLILFVNVTGDQLQANVILHVEIRYLICRSGQMAGFYMECNIGLKCFDRKVP